MRQNIAGRLAGLFLQSKLTPLLMAAALGIGAFSLFTMPSEEEPQIVVPLADIYMPLPGATPQEVEGALRTACRQQGSEECKESRGIWEDVRARWMESR